MRAATRLSVSAAADEGKGVGLQLHGCTCASPASFLVIFVRRRQRRRRRRPLCCAIGKKRKWHSTESSRWWSKKRNKNWIYEGGGGGGPSGIGISIASCKQGIRKRRRRGAAAYDTTQPTHTQVVQCEILLPSSGQMAEPRCRCCRCCCCWCSNHQKESEFFFFFCCV